MHSKFVCKSGSDVARTDSSKPWSPNAALVSPLQFGGPEYAVKLMTIDGLKRTPYVRKDEPSCVMNDFAPICVGHIVRKEFDEQILPIRMSQESVI